ncbi:hypothetical protein FQR65_LT12456 [Abscondita terminalis]|nr:hypothetical protein FQR65_LT12456 [Abscondita terminalis]
MVDLELLEPLVGQVLTSLIYAHIESHITKTCKDNFDNSFINALEMWLDNFIIKWLHKVYCCGQSSDSDGYITIFKRKLTNFLYETYTKMRINQLFNIIIEYPESLPALEDLGKCLPKTDLRPLLTKKLQKAMETRLLHPGVSTPDILTAYVASIRSMRVLDPSGLLLEMVTQPMHQYLRSREDTVRCVVSSLTEEGPNDLAEELVKGDAVHVDENAGSDEESENWENWMPDPVDIDRNKSSTVRRTSDIISMLVSVYGSKELFINEYRTLLADRLLSQFSCDTEKEIRYLELLKLRFGDSQLHYCEVMLKDIADSKRINHHIKQDTDYTENNFSMSAMIVSAQFWPPFKDEKLELHNKVVSQMEAFTAAFETLKGNRTLSWKNHLGIVDLEIELLDRTLNLSVTPVHATILMYFQDKNEWELETLSRVVQIPPTVLRKKIGFWQSHGLVEETKSNVFSLIEERESNCPNLNVDVVVEDYESESIMASTQDQREEELQTFWSYIVGMLMNLDALSLERIHQMLKMFAFQGPTIECSIQELAQFLDRKVREHQLVFSGGLYRLPKNDMAHTWLRYCGREDLTEHVSKAGSYKLCSAHFEDRMYLNDLKNRLMPTAVPTLFPLTERSSNTANEHSYCLQALDLVNVGPLLEIEHVQIIKPPSTAEPTPFPLMECSSNTDNEHSYCLQQETDPLDINVEIIKPEPPIMSSSSTQTDVSLIINTSQKIKFRKTIKKLRNNNHLLHKKVNRLKIDLEEAKKKSLDDISLEQYMQLTNKFCPIKEFADFINVQISQLSKQPRGRRYSLEFKNECLSMYFADPKLYKQTLMEKFCLPSPVTLLPLLKKVKLESLK